MDFLEEIFPGIFPGIFPDRHDQTDVMVYTVDMSKTKTTISDRIKERRAKLNMTALDLSREIGISHRTVQRYESGERLPDLEVAARIAVALSVSLDWLAGIDR